MNFDWNSFKILADELKTHGVSSPIKEAYYRTATSRYYYSVYKVALTYLIDKHGYTEPNEGKHNSLYNEFIKKVDTKERLVGKNLKCLWWERVDSDYIDDQYEDKKVDLAKGYQERVFKNLSELGANI
jgi:uncharacterized protein (UPF0332 family)